MEQDTIKTIVIDCGKHTIDEIKNTYKIFENKWIDEEDCLLYLNILCEDNVLWEDIDHKFHETFEHRMNRLRFSQR